MEQAQVHTFKPNVYRGYLPTQLDIDKLNAAYPPEELVAGTEIPYTAFEKVIGSKYRSNRYNTVVHRWRKVMQQKHKITFRPLQGRALVVCDDDKKIEVVNVKIGVASTYLRNARIIHSGINRNLLTKASQAAFDQNSTRLGTMIATEQRRTPYEPASLI